MRPSKHYALTDSHRRDLYVNARECRRDLVGILAAWRASVEHRDHGRRGDGPDARRRVGRRFNVQHGRSAG